MRLTGELAAVLCIGGLLGCGGDATAPGGTGTTSTTTGSGEGGAGQGGSSTTSSTSSSTSGAGGSGGSTATCSAKTGAAGDQPYTLTWAGAERAYRVHAPPGYDGSTATPVVLVFHGYTETADQIETVTKMTPVTDAHGAIVVYAQGLGNSWNAGTCCGSSATGDVDDAGFVGAMLDAIEDAYCVDDRRVFSAGFSNGGMLSHRLACELSDRIAAIGPVSGTIAVGTCNVTRPVSVMHFHGTSDPIVWYDGGLGNAQSVPDTISGWVARDGCGTTPATTFSMGDAHCETYDGCMQAANVTLCTLEGGGHQWPGGEPGGVGTLNTDISASDAMMEFFEAHPMM